MAPPAPARPLLNWQRNGVWSWVILGCVLLFAAAVRFRLRDVPLERDEGEYAYGGQLLLRGMLPGQLIYTLKLPGTHVAYACLMVFFGQTCAGIHLGFLLVNCATIAVLFWLARTLVGPLAGCVAAATYALMSLSAGALGTSAHATHFVVFAALAGLLLLWQAAKGARPWTYLAAGFLLGSSILMKQNGMLFAAFGTLWLVWLGCSRQLGSKSSFLKAASFFFSGITLPFVLLLLVLWAAHSVENCWFWWVTYARAYSKPYPGLNLLWTIMIERMPVVMELPFYVAPFGLAALWRKRSSWQVALFVSGFLFFSFLAIFPGLHFRPHYFVLLMPALALLVGALVGEATRLLEGSRFKILVWAPVLVFAFFFARGIARERNFFFRLTPLEAVRALYGSEPFPEGLVVADYVRAHSVPEARIAVLGSEPEIYFYSHRRSATGYVYTYPLTEHQQFAAQMRQQMMQEIEAARPLFVVQVCAWSSWQSRPASQQRIRELGDALIPPGYKLIGACDREPDQSQANWHWYPQGTKDPPNPASELLLFERINSP